MTAVSVVVPTRDRKNLLPACLQALAAQRPVQGGLEIIVVNDGSRDGTAQWLDRQRDHHPTLRIVTLNGVGPAKARNAGIAAARGEVVAFTDDDCLPAPDWLQTAVSRLAKEPDLLGISGRTVSIPEQITPFTHQVEDDLPYSFPTCNVAYRREILERIGGFDEGYPFPYNEDWDLSFSVAKEGRIGYEPGMLVIHPPRPEPFCAPLRRVPWLETEFRLYRRHRDAYRRSVHRHPLRVILYHQILVQSALRLWRFRRWAIRHPLIYLQLLAMLICRKMLILFYIPAWWLHHRLRQKELVRAHRD